jgi:hypothetical protein
MKGDSIMSNLNAEQIASFNTFATGVQDYMDSKSTGKGGARFFTESAHFGVIWKALIDPTFVPKSEKDEVGRPSMLRSVMNNTVQLQERGYTKEVYQLRYPETKEDGTPHPEAGKKIYRVNGESVLSKHHCVMFTKDAFRANRREVTGLKGEEPIYAISWDAVPKDLKQQLAQKFPAKGEEYPKFTPLALGFLLRKGSKPKSGQKRHSWAGIEILVGGKYGDNMVIIRGTYKQRRPGLVARLANNLNIDCPSWDVEKKAEVTPSADYASVSAALLNECGF